MLLVCHEAAGAPRGGWPRDADGWAVVLKAMGTMKAEPLSWIAKECPRSGMVISPGLESKLCLKPKKSRMTRTEYSIELQAGMSKMLGTS